jgi:hypothetical protein
MGSNQPPIPWLTYLLTPRSRVLLEKLTCSQLVKKFPAYYGTRRFIGHSQVSATCPYPTAGATSPTVKWPWCEAQPTTHLQVPWPRNNGALPRLSVLAFVVFTGTLSLFSATAGHPKAVVSTFTQSIITKWGMREIVR